MNAHPLPSDAPELPRADADDPRGGARYRRGSRSTAEERGITLPPDAQWRRVHPITPLLEGWKGITAVLAILVWQNVEYVGDAYSALQEVQARVSPRLFLGAALAVLGVVVVIGLGLWLSWRMRSYAVDRDAVYLRTGVFNRQLRTARLPRIQSVDIVHPLLGRIFGLGRLKVEVAGGRESHVTIGFLRTRDMESLRDRILSLAAGEETVDEASEGSDARVMPSAAESGTTGVSSAAGADATTGRRAGSGQMDAARKPSAPLGFEDAVAAQPIPEERLYGAEHYLYEVDTRILIGSMLRSGATLAAVVVSVNFLVVLAVWLRIGAFQDDRPLAVFFSVLPMLTIPFGFGAYAWSRFDKGWRFRAAATPAGIRTRFGLTAETSSTLPPGRVHGVQIEQGLLWRWRDWWRVEVSVAGRNAAETKSSGAVENTGANVLLPVGRRETALRALWLVVPDLGVADPDAFLESALTGQDQDGVGDERLAVENPGRGFIRISPRGRLYSPLAWRREAIALTDTCVVLRLGRWRRRISVIPYERIQSLRLWQGPFARRRGMAALHLDMVDTEIARTLSNLDLADAAAIERVISERALRRRREERLDRWLARATENS